MKEFDRLIEKSKANKDTDVLFDKLKSAVKTKGLERHKWQTNAVDSIVSSKTTLLQVTLWSSVPLSLVKHEFR